MKTYSAIFPKIVDAENLFRAFFRFRAGKASKTDVAAFEHDLERNIFDLRRDLISKTYRHGPYAGFFITDPKQRHIHKATVRDRIVHHAIHSILNPCLEETFIEDSFSCRVGYGTHRGVDRLRTMLRRASANNRKTVIAMKCDVRKFFASIDHEVLIRLLEGRIKDPDAMHLLREIIGSFNPGLPIGNLTSQMLANFYMTQADRFIKEKLRVPFYIRYTDDFILISSDRRELEGWLRKIQAFLHGKLKLSLHPQKVSFHTFANGVDFLGYVQFPHHRGIRTTTKRRIFKNVRRGVKEEALISYLGVLAHADAHGLAEEMVNEFGLRRGKKPVPKLEQ